MSKSQVKKLQEGLETEGFIVVTSDDTGLIVSRLELPEGFRHTIHEAFLSPSLNISITAKGLILVSVFGWYTVPDIQSGEDAEVSMVMPILKYLEKVLKNVVEEDYEIKLIRGLRKCFFENPGAYEGSF